VTINGSGWAGNLTSVHDQAKFYTIDLARAKQPVDHRKRMLPPFNNHDDLQILKFVPGGEQLSTEMIGWTKFSAA
jgi:hypothetical protein